MASDRPELATVSKSPAMAGPRDGWASLRAAAPPLLLGLVLLGLIFRQEVAAAISVWSTSTAYNHCFLVLPIALWMAYDRRRWLPGVPAAPLPWVGLAVLPCAAAWLVAERLGIMEGRQLMAMASVDLLFLAVLGWRLAWLLSAPLLYLFFLVPFGSFLTPFLQDFTAHFIVSGLDFLGIANISDGNTIEIPEGIFFVAEACAGLRFLIASIAFGVLYAVTFYHSPGRRIAFVVASMIVPVLANGVRALGIVVAGHWVGSAQAAAADHLVYGWLFFSCVTLLLIVCGLPFRQDGQAEPRPALARVTAHPGVLAMVLPAILVAGLAVAGPLLAAGLDNAAATEMVAAPNAIAGCVAQDVQATNRFWSVGSSGEQQAPGGASARGFACSDGAIQLLVVAFPPRTNPNIVLALQRSLTEPPDVEDTQMGSLAGVQGWKLVTTTNRFHIAATALWLDGAASSGGLRTRLQQARNSLTTTGHTPVLAVVRATSAGSPGGESAAIARYLRDANGGGPQLAMQMAELSDTPAKAR